MNKKIKIIIFIIILLLISILAVGVNVIIKNRRTQEIQVNNVAINKEDSNEEKDKKRN